jgi:PilZ domain
MSGTTRSIETRRHERYPFFRRAKWDFFTGNTGRKTGYVMNISRSGCLLKASEPIDHRRWIRVVIHDHPSNLYFTHIGRVIRREDRVESLESPEIDGGYDITLHRYGIEFTHPSYLTTQADLILALSSRNLTVRSCLNLNSKSSLRDGSLP